MAFKRCCSVEMLNSYHSCTAAWLNCMLDNIDYGLQLDRQLLSSHVECRVISGRIILWNVSAHSPCFQMLSLSSKLILSEPLAEPCRTEPSRPTESPVPQLIFAHIPLQPRLLSSSSVRSISSSLPHLLSGPRVLSPSVLPSGSAHHFAKMSISFFFLRVGLGGG
jgi:hypothetical protein